MKKKMIAGGLLPLYISAFCVPDLEKAGENRKSKDDCREIDGGKGPQQI